jgi:hypothetical protein
MRQLPVLAAVRHVWVTVFSNAGAAFRLSWPWLLILAAAGAILAYNAPKFPGPQLSRQAAGTLAWLVPLVAIVNLVAMSSIAVNWHRYVLLDQMPKGLEILRIDRLVGRYIGNAFLMSIAVLIPFAIVFFISISALRACCLPFPMGTVPFSWARVSFAIALLVLLFMIGNAVVYRLGIKLPAVALGSRDYKFVNALLDTRGNFLRIMAFVFLLILSIAIPQQLINWLAAPLVNALGLIGSIQVFIARIVLQWFGLIVGISALTSLYGFFAEEREF